MKIKVFDWRNRRSWLSAMRRYAGHILTQELRAELAGGRPKCWSDNFEWLPEAEFVIPDFVEAMTNYYSHFKAFHGCRPRSLDSYYTHGLVGQNFEPLIRSFREIFADVAKDDIKRAIDKFVKRGQQGQGAIWLLADDQLLIKECGHYIIQGSEFLMALAANLGHGPSGEDYRFRLRNYGIPTVLEVDLPIGLVPPHQHVEVAKSLLSEWGQLAARRPLGFGSEGPLYVVRGDIPAECIRSHYHPAKVVDPHRGFRPYINNTLRCDFCQ